MRPLFLLLLGACLSAGQSVPNVKDYISCPNSVDGRQPYRVNQQTAGHLFKVVINAPGAVCK